MLYVSPLELIHADCRFSGLLNTGLNAAFYPVVVRWAEFLAMVPKIPLLESPEPVNVMSYHSSNCVMLHGAVDFTKERYPGGLNHST